MSKLERRLLALEQTVNEDGNRIPPSDRYHVIFDDGDADRKIAQIKKDVVRKYGTNRGLVFIVSRVPEPLPLPETGEQASGLYEAFLAPMGPQP